MTRPLFHPGFVKASLDEYANIVSALDTTTPWVNRDGAPRNECFMALDESLTYSYGKSAAVRHEYQAAEMSAVAYELLDLLNYKTDAKYNVVVLNRYHDRDQHLGWHCDDSPEQDVNHPIAVISFGAERWIYVRENGFSGVVPQENRFLLTQGSLFVMPAGYQETHQHKIPKHDRDCGLRISLTFRKLDR